MLSRYFLAVSAPATSFIQPLLFRVDGSSTTGLGHLIRCQALAQILQPAFQAVFVVREIAPAIHQQLLSASILVRLIPKEITSKQEAQWLSNSLSPNDILILDGYQFDPDYQKVVAAGGTALVCLDDLITLPAWATVVLNQAGGVEPLAYTRVPLAKLYLGPAYALLRPEFWENTTKPVATSNLPRLFLNMGGADPTNQTALLLPQLREQFPTYSLVVVTGAAYPYQVMLQELIHELGGSIVFYHNLSAAELAAQLHTCQVFVCPPSGVAYECCATGGAILLHPTAGNQRALFEFLVQSGLAIPLTTGITLAEGALTELVAQQRMKQRQLFDGQASQRLRKVFTQLAKEQQYTIRRAALSDAYLYFTWANDSVVRSNAIHSETITWENHSVWFNRRLQDIDCYLYLISTSTNEPLGQVRIEFDGATLPGTIDYSIASSFRGQGLGQFLLRRALQQLRLDRPALAGGAVQGQVKATNKASLRVFEQLRFVRHAAVTLQGEEFINFRLDFPFAS